MSPVGALYFGFQISDYIWLGHGNGFDVGMISSVFELGFTGSDVLSRCVCPWSDQSAGLESMGLLYQVSVPY
jgi:hypothetical protein